MREYDTSPRFSSQGPAQEKTRPERKLLHSKGILLLPYYIITAMMVVYLAQPKGSLLTSMLHLPTSDWQAY
jgi:hypothetical protein